MARPAVTRSRSPPDRPTTRSSCSTRASRLWIVASRCSSACLSSWIEPCSGSGEEGAAVCGAIPPSTSIVTMRPSSRLKERIRTPGNTPGRRGRSLRPPRPGAQHPRAQVIGYAGDIDRASPAECDGPWSACWTTLYSTACGHSNVTRSKSAVDPGPDLDSGCRSGSEVDLLAAGLRDARRLQPWRA